MSLRVYAGDLGRPGCLPSLCCRHLLGHPELGYHNLHIVCLGLQQPPREQRVLSSHQRCPHRSCICHQRQLTNAQCPRV